MNWLAAGASLKVVGVQFEKSSSQWKQGSVDKKIYQTQLTKGIIYYIIATTLLSQPPFAFTP
jgi:hypothetical protein